MPAVVYLRRREENTHRQDQWKGTRLGRGSRQKPPIVDEPASVDSLITRVEQVLKRAGIGRPTTPIGGNIVGHASTYRIYLRRGKKGSRVAKMIDSPNLPENEIIFHVTKDGVRDDE